MREVHKQHYACALNVASEQRTTDFKPGISWFVAQVVPETAKQHQGTFAPEHYLRSFLKVRSTHKHTWGPILHPAQFTFYSGACVVASLQPAQRVLFPPPPHVGKLGNDLAPQGAVRRKEEACSGANVPWCYFAVSVNKCATNQEIPGLKLVARCSDAILRMHA